MSHRVGDDVDPHGVSPFDRELFKVIRVFAFSFPAVSEVRIVAQQYHDSACIVADSTVIHLTGV